MKKLIVYLLALYLGSNCLLAQDPSYSQPYANPLYLNPAFAGTDTMQRIALNFRDQWPNIPGAIDYNIAYDRNIIDSCLSIGLLANQDRAGQNTLITTNASLILGGQIHIKSFTLSAGFQATLHQKTLNQNNLTMGDMIDPRRGFVFSTNEQLARTTVSVPDFTAGLLGYGKHYFVGFAINHLTEPDESFVAGASPLPRKYVFNIGGIIKIDSVVTIYPTFVYTKQQDFHSEQVECYVSYKFLTAGIGYRFQDAMMFTIGFQSKYLRIGYCYDYTISALTNTVTWGSHEASLAVLLPYKTGGKLNKKTGIHCPSF